MNENISALVIFNRYKVGLVQRLKNQKAVEKPGKIIDFPFLIQNKAVRLAKMFGLAIIFVKSFYPPKPCPKMLIKFRNSFFYTKKSNSY